MTTTSHETIDDYIASFPANIQTLLELVRNTVKAAAPDAQETIKYAMPTFVLNGNLVHFAAFKNHIGFYSTPSGHTAFQEELSAYKGAKGSVQFPINQPMPLDLITRIVKFRAQENLEKGGKK
ncbi:iron chaperone [Larkinella arboricola]